MIRLPEIPQLQPTQIGFRKSSTDGLLVNSAQAARSAALPGLELTSLANAVGEVSDVYWDYLGEIQKGEDDRTTNEGKRDLAKAYSDHGVSLQEDFDPASRINKTRQFFENYKKNINFDDVSRKSQAEILEHFEDIAAQGVISQTEESMKMGVKRSLLASENSVKESMRSNDLVSAVATIEGQPNMTSEEKEAAIFNVKTQHTLDQHKVAMFDDPSAWMVRYPDAKSAGVSDMEFPDLKNLAERYLNEQINESTDEAFDEISASWIANKDDPKNAGINRDQAIERYKGLPEKTVLALGNFAANLANGAFQAERVTEKFINTTSGEIINLIKAYEPGMEVLPGMNVEKETMEKAADRLEILNRLNRLLPGPNKDYLLGLLNDKEAMVQADVKTNLDLVLKDLDTLDDQGQLGRLPVPKPMQMEQVTKSKFLKDAEKLRALGISELDITSITKELTTTKQVEAFQKAYKKRGAMVGADDLIIATAEAILNGSSSIGFIEPLERNVYFAADTIANEKRGRYMIQLRKMSELVKGISYEKLNEALMQMIDADKQAEQSKTR